MNINTFILMLLVLFLSIGVVSANELSDVNVTSIVDESPLDNLDDINLDDSNIPQVSLQDSLQSSDVNVTSIADESPMEVVGDINYFDENFEDFNVLQVSSQSSLQSNDDIIVVSNWDELQYYCAQTDKDYTLKLKENTNFYPTNPNNPIFQIKIRNNVKILGSEGSWIGDSSSDPNQLTFLAIVVEDDIKVGLTLDNVTFKWIKAGGGTYLPDGMLIKIGGKKIQL